VHKPGHALGGHQKHDAAIDKAQAAAGAGHRDQAAGSGHVEPFEPDAAKRSQTLGKRHQAPGGERAEPSLRQRLTCGVGMDDLAAIAGHHDQRRVVADKGRQSRIPPQGRQNVGP
jgi:hypothetical protein